jgi:hypothetical protein
MNIFTWIKVKRARKSKKWGDWYEIWRNTKAEDKYCGEARSNLMKIAPDFNSANIVYKHITDSDDIKRLYLMTLIEKAKTEDDLALCLEYAVEMYIGDQTLISRILPLLVRVATKTETWWLIFENTFDYPDIQEVALKNTLKTVSLFDQLFELINFDPKGLSAKMFKMYSEEKPNLVRRIKAATNTVFQYKMIKEELCIVDTDHEIAERIADGELSFDDTMYFLKSVKLGPARQNQLLENVRPKTVLYAQLRQVFEVSPTGSIHQLWAWETMLAFASKVNLLKELYYLSFKAGGYNLSPIVEDMIKVADNATDLDFALNLKKCLELGVARDIGV